MEPSSDQKQPAEPSGRRRHYEFFFLVDSSLAPEAASAFSERVHALINELGGETVLNGARSSGSLELRRLAYPLRRKTQAYSGLIEFRSLPEVPERLTLAFRHDQALLRSFVLKKAARVKKRAPTRPFGAFLESKNAAPVKSRTASPEPEKKTALERLSIVDIDKKIEELIG